MSQIKLTPMQQVLAAIHDIRKENTYEASPMIFMQWMANNIDKLLYEEKYNIVDSFDAGNDPFEMNRKPKTKSKGQEFFENNFINL